MEGALSLYAPIQRMECGVRIRDLVSPARKGGRRAVMAGLVVALAIVSFLFYQERSINRAANTQSAKLLSTFLQGDTSAAASDSGVYLRLENVRFKWSDRTDVLIRDAAPQNPFVFSLTRDAELIPQSRIDIKNTKSVRVTMP